MSESEWVVGQLAFQQRMPPLPAGKMTDAQRKAADEMIAGPRKGVKGPFVPLLRCPELMDRLQKVGEYLRFQSSLDQRISEFVMLVVSRAWTQHFEWFVHVPLGRKAGISEDTIAALADGRRPSGMSEDEDLAYDFCDELLRNKGVSETTYRRGVLHPFVLRGVALPLDAVAGLKVKGLRRMGKRIVFELEGALFLVLHLMIAGRLRWLAKDKKPPGRISLAALEFEDGALIFTEAGTKRRASIHLVEGEAALAAMD